MRHVAGEPLSKRIAAARNAQDAEEASSFLELEVTGGGKQLNPGRGR